MALACLILRTVPVLRVIQSSQRTNYADLTIACSLSLYHGIFYPRCGKFHVLGAGAATSWLAQSYAPDAFESLPAAGGPLPYHGDPHGRRDDQGGAVPVLTPRRFTGRDHR